MQRLTEGFYFTSAVLRHLRPKPASLFCLVALMQSGKPENAEYLERYTSFSDKTVKDALDFLNEEGLITRNGRYSWQLSSYASQLPLMAQTELSPSGVLPADGIVQRSAAPMASTGDIPVAGAGSEDVSTSIRDPENLRLGVSGSSSSSRSLIKDSRILNDDLLLARGPDPENLRVLLAALDEWGVREPARSAIAGIPGMTLARIDYHCGKCQTLGQAIYRIKNDWPYEASEYADPVIKK
jgi:hypothetical protein